jgi:hypothetical protein
VLLLFLFPRARRAHRTHVGLWAGAPVSWPSARAARRAGERGARERALCARDGAAVVGVARARLTLGASLARDSSATGGGGSVFCPRRVRGRVAHARWPGARARAGLPFPPARPDGVASRPPL